jgi:tetratricopeptide (TPR) repeat protein
MTGGRGMRRRGLVTATLMAGMVMLLLPYALRAQKPRFANDPILGPILKAQREGRLLDAKKLLETAIQEAEGKSPPDPRLRPLLTNLAGLDMRMGFHAEALAIAKQILKRDEETYGAESPRLLADLNNLGTFYEMTGNDAEAGQTFERELALARENHGAGLLGAIANVARYDLKVHRTEDAKALLAEAVEICDTNPEPHFPDCSGFRSQLAEIYRKEGDPGRAEAMVGRGAEHSVGVIRDWYTQVNDLNALAGQYEDDGSYDLAETTYRQAIALIENTKYLKNPEGAADIERERLASLFEKEGHTNEAEDIYLKNVESAEKQCGPDHPEHALNLSAAVIPLIPLYREENRLAELEPILQNILAIQESDLGASSARLVDTLRMLGDIYRDEEKYVQAAPVYERAIQIQEKNAGPDSPQLLGLLNSYAMTLGKLGENDEAQAVGARATALRDKLRTQSPSSHN